MYTRHLLLTGYKATLTGIFLNVADKGNFLHIGVSLCTPEDNFCRATGRRASTKRAYENPTFAFHVTDEVEAKVMFHSLATILQAGLAYHEGVNSLKRLLEISKTKN